MANRIQLESYKLFFEQVPVKKPAANLPAGRQAKPIRKARIPALGRSLLETPAR